MDRTVVSGLILLSLVAGAGCKHQKPINYGQELPPGAKALRKISPAEYPDFSKCEWNLANVAQSVDFSLAYMAHPSSRSFYPYLDVSHERAVASLRAFRELVNDAMRQPNKGAYIDQKIRADFEVYKSIGAPNPEGPGYTDIVMFTAYCCPNRDASLVRTGEYQWPIYKRPADLVSDPVSGETTGRKMPDGSIQPYWTRAEIEGQGRLAGQEFAWLKSRWEAYVVTVQGSARLRLPDGKIMEVGYAGHNGYPYTSPGKQLVTDGAIKKEDLNLRTLGQYFGSNPAAQDKYLWLNKRTVFFKERPGGPYGCLNVPVSTMGTIATDKDVYPRAMPGFLTVPLARSDNPTQTWPFSGFMMDQDAGGAIRAAGRCDIYMGVGDAAERLAGYQMAEGALYYVAIKPELISRYATPTPPEQIPAARATTRPAKP